MLRHPFLQFAELQPQVSGLILQRPPFQRQAGQLVLQLTFLQFVCPKWSITQLHNTVISYLIKEVSSVFRIRGSLTLTNGPPDPALFVSDLQMATKNYFFLSIFAHYFSKVHLHHSSQIKSHKEVTKQRKSRFFSLVLLNDRRIRFRSLIRIHTSN